MDQIAFSFPYLLLSVRRFISNRISLLLLLDRGTRLVARGRQPEQRCRDTSIQEPTSEWDQAHPHEANHDRGRAEQPVDCTADRGHGQAQESPHPCSPPLRLVLRHPTGEAANQSDDGSYQRCRVDAHTQHAQSQRGENDALQHGGHTRGQTSLLLPSTPGSPTPATGGRSTPSS